MTKKIIFYLMVMLPLFWQCGGKGNNNPEPQKLTITGIDPSSGSVGTTVTITGTNFSTTPANNVVKFNGTDATVTVASATSLTVTVPQGATTGKITVSVGGQTITSSGDFTIIAPSPSAPAITGFSPSSGPVGTTVTITGTNFSTTLANNVVKINGVIATVLTATPTILTVTVPQGATPGKITVQVNTEIATSDSDFNVTNYWIRKADFGGVARYSGIGFSIGNKGYAGLGITLSTSNIFHKDFWEYDPATNTWTQKADFGGTARKLSNSGSMNGKGYVFGGDIGSSSVKDVWEYDPATNTWTRKGDMPINMLATATIGNKTYGLTGYNDAFYEYNPATDVWTIRATFPGIGTARYSTNGFAIGNKAYFGGGIITAGPSTQPSNDFYEYDPATNTWTRKADAPSYSYPTYTFVIGTKAYFNNYVYDPTANTWTAMTSMFNSNITQGAFGFSINGKGYAGTGYLSNNENTKEFWEYNPQ